MAVSPLMLPIAGVFLVACVSGIMSQSPSPPLQSSPPPSPPSPSSPSPPPPSRPPPSPPPSPPPPSVPSPPPPSGTPPPPPSVPSPPPPSGTPPPPPSVPPPPPPSVPPPSVPPPPPPSVPPPTSLPPPQPPPLPPLSSPPSSPPLPSSPPSPPLSPPLPSSPPSPPLSSPSSPPLSSPPLPPTLSPLSSSTPSSPPSLPPLISLAPLSPPSLPPISLSPLSPISLPPISPISLPPLSPSSPSQAPATRPTIPLSPSSPSQAPAPSPTSGVVYSKPSFNSTFFVHQTLLLVAGPGGDLSNLQLGSVAVVTDVIKETSDPSSKVLGMFQGQYLQDGNETLHVTATATIYADSGNPYNTTYEIVGQRTSLTSTDGVPLSVVSGIQFNLETKEYSYGLTGIAFINTVFTQTSPQKLSLVPSPSPSHPSEVEVPQALQQNTFQISIFFCKDGRCQF